MRFLPLLVALVAAASQPSPAVPELWAGLQPGKYSVGYRVVEKLKPPTSVWYPAAPPAAPNDARMSMRVFMDTNVEAFRGFLKSAGMPEPAIERYMNSPLAASRDAKPAPGSFPIVALAQGNRQTAADQAVLAEFLASHGYLVVTTASPMMTRPMTSDAQIPVFADQQAADLTIGVANVSRWPSANGAVGFAIGHSFGARAALLLAMHNPKVRGVVSLDGGIGSATGRDKFMAMKTFNKAKATAPILHFYEELDAFTKPDFSLLKSLPGSLTLRSLPGMHHNHFTTFGFGAAVIPEMARASKAGPEIRASVTQMANETLAFLERHRR